MTQDERRERQENNCRFGKEGGNYGEGSDLDYCYRHESYNCAKTKKDDEVISITREAEAEMVEKEIVNIEMKSEIGIRILTNLLESIGILDKRLDLSIKRIEQLEKKGN